MPGSQDRQDGQAGQNGQARQNGPDSDAIELFAQRAAAVAPGFAVTPDNRADVIRLCQHLDGIPLAIELAAVQLRAVSVRQLARRLDRRFGPLAGLRRGGLPHHQTLRAATQWSYDLCSPAERLLWARLSVFAGSFDIAAAEDICADDPLAREDILATLIGLVDKSVVLRDERDGARYRLLDTIAEYGAERLAGAQAAVRDRHIGYYLTLVSEFSDQAKNDDQLSRYRRLRRDHANIRAALGYALSLPDRAEAAASMAADLRSYWVISGLLREGRHWLTRILDRYPSARRAWLLMARGMLATLQGDLGEAVADLELSTAMAGERGEALAYSLGAANLCLAFTFSGRHAEAAAMGAVAQERLTAIDHHSGLVALDIHLGYMHLLNGEFALAIDRCSQGLLRLGDTGELWARGYLHVITATALLFQDKHDESAAMARKALEMKHEIGDISGTGYCLEALAMLAARQQRPQRAAWLLGAADPLWQRVGRRLGGNAIIEELHQQTAKAARDALGADRYGELFRRGAGHPLDLIIALAVGDAEALAEPAGPDQPGPAPLTRRERQVAAMVTEGLSNREIAQRLVISKRTVDAHVEHIFAKLGVGSRVELALRLTT